MRMGVPILEYPLSKPPPNSGITTTLLFAEFEACIAAGLDIDRWMSGGYDKMLKAYVVAWYRLHSAVESHGNDAAMADANRKGRH